MRISAAWKHMCAAASNQRNVSQEKRVFDVREYASLLQKCGVSGTLSEGRRIHGEILEHGHGNNVFLCNHLVQMYGKCGSIEEAYEVFAKIEARNVFSWAIMIGALVQNGLASPALEFYHRMDNEGVKADMVVLVNVLTACSNLGSLSQGKAVHARIEAMGFDSNEVVANALLNMYCKAGSLEDAKIIFEKTEQNVVAWTALIYGYMMHGLNHVSFRLFKSMMAEGVRPNEVTFTSVLGACAAVGALSEGQSVHRVLSESEYLDCPGVGTALIDMYGKCGRPGLARTVFERLTQKDVVVWNAMIAISAQHGLDKEAVKLFVQMDVEGQAPDDVTSIAVLDACSNLKELIIGRLVHEFVATAGLENIQMVGNSLVNMYGKCGSIENARELFDRLNSRNVITWSTMISIYTSEGFGKEALALLQQMDNEGVKPDEYTFTSILEACSVAGALSDGRRLHRRLQLEGLEKQTVIGTALITMYGKCGNLEAAQGVFRRVSVQNLVSWTALISAYSQQGDAESSVFLREMSLEGIQVDDIVFLSLLHGSSHAGSLKDGLKCFFSMVSDYHIDPCATHYGCLVDLFARCGRLLEAEELLHGMPFIPDIMEVKTLLAACRVVGDASRAARVAELASGLLPDDSAPYVLMSHMYASAEKWEEMADVRESMLRSGVKKLRGWSSIEVKNRLHQFFAGEFSWHPLAALIAAHLSNLQQLLKEAGYEPDTKQVVHCVDEGEKAELLSLHSEKVALAFGLMSTPDGTPLHIVKNLRICADCHTVMKLVSRSTGRVLVVRDVYRFHRFENGTCSCRDYW